VLNIRLKLGIVELEIIENTRDQVFGEKIQDRWMNVRVLEIHVDLVPCGVADQTFIVREGEIGRSCAISLVVCNDSIVEQRVLIQIVVRPPGSAEVRLEDAFKLREASKLLY
jgi:hypothetical protein